MAKHLMSKEEILNYAKIQKVIEDTVNDKLKHTDDMIAGVHVADFLITLTVLSDWYNADDEWLDGFIDLCVEFINQYNEGKMTIRQLRRHLVQKHGINIINKVKQEIIPTKQEILDET